ncbi:uncharacterized protein LOC125471866 [Pyrus x bretschneideri]|uniref:uncharacterized protein LOC125471866 n=1 Tax=Pyrus x bretschneideri TaxID=225117 RepID=UPI002030C04A|nr:uncharacterized protein LOC125471866 [Pyrus x bretschneideri]
MYPILIVESPPPSLLSDIVTLSSPSISLHLLAVALYARHRRRFVCSSSPSPVCFPSPSKCPAIEDLKSPIQGAFRHFVLQNVSYLQSGNLRSGWILKSTKSKSFYVKQTGGCPEMSSYLQSGNLRSGWIPKSTKSKSFYVKVH